MALEKEINKKSRSKKKYHQLRLDSMTAVNPKHTHGTGIWGNPRVVMGVRVDEGLKKQFNLAAKALFGSTCNPIETFMAAVVGIYQNQELLRVNPSPTINIGEIKIERNLRERRKLTKTVTLEEETETSVTVTKCGFRGCENEAVCNGLYIPQNRVVPLCPRHVDLTNARAELGDWRVL
jgi:hypothetical protein